MESDAQARERRPPGRHSPPQAGGREGPRVRGWFASRPHATVESDAQARERRPPGRHSPPQAGGREGPRVRGWFASRPHATVESDAQARERRPPGRHSPPQAGGREGPRVRGWFASRLHATVQSDAQARERRPPGRHSPPQAGGREGPRVQGWFASRQGPRRSASSGRLRGTRLSRRFAQRCRPGGRRSLLCRRNRTPEHALTRRRGCPAPPNRMRPAPPETTTPTLPAPATILPGRRGVAQSGRAPGSGSGGRRFKSCRPDAARPHGRVPAPRRPRRPAVSDAFFPAPSHPGGGRAFRHSPMDQNVYIPALLPKTFVPVSALFLALAS